MTTKLKLKEMDYIVLKEKYDQFSVPKKDNECGRTINYDPFCFTRADSPSPDTKEANALTTEVVSLSNSSTKTAGQRSNKRYSGKSRGGSV